MAEWIEPECGSPADYRGLHGIFEYINADGALRPVNCGQAASATLLTHGGTFPAAAAEAGKVMRLLEAEHPPNIAFGKLGTSRGRVERILRAYGFEPKALKHEAALRESLDRNKPVAVMCQMSGHRVFGIPVPSGHWMVAYGYDAETIYLSNYGSMPWAEFRRLWCGLVPTLIGMRNTGLSIEEKGEPPK